MAFLTPYTLKNQYFSRERLPALCPSMLGDCSETVTESLVRDVQGAYFSSLSAWVVLKGLSKQGK